MISLFEKYGGFAAVHPLVSAFYDQVLESDIISYMFDDIDMPQLIDHQTKFIASVMGGPASFSDDALHKAHSHLNIKEEEWDEVVTLLHQTLKDFNIEEPDIAALLSAVASKKSLIVAQHD